ncbi:MAG: putative manganese-dependent inorganic diphosphatase [Clostridia bacterium]|jgi:manganese-dependent inorganic pyrophosphatase|nr:putative manganese-dependent inorganic diphosphatase [Clostridia bacterium]
MNRDIFVFGHQSPDTDSICSAIAYANLKREIGYKFAKAARLGEINKETEFVLNRFSVEKPILLKDAKPQISDLMYYNNPVITKGMPIKKAWESIKSTSRPMMPVIDENEKFEGVIAISDITKAYIELSDDDTLARFNTSFENLLSVLEGKIISGGYKYETITGKIYTDSTLKEGMKLTDADIVVTGHEPNLQNLAIKLGAGCIIVTANDYEETVCHLENEVVSAAIIKVPYKFFKTIKLINQSIPVEAVMKTENLITFTDDDYIEEAKEIVQNVKFRHFPVVDENGNIKGTISRRHFIDFNKKRVILVDHNEKGQSISGLDEATIMEVIDHHRIADINTTNPLFFRAEPVGCTSTIVYKMYKESGVIPSKEMAGLMLSAILSDTLIFKSPTCTDIDKNIALELADIVGVNHEEYGKELLIAGTSLEGRSIEDLYTGDMKEFKVGHNKVLISQLNTADLNGVLENKKEEIIDIMTKVAETKGCDAAVLMVTDIIEEGTVLLFAGEKAKLFSTPFEMKMEDQSEFLKGVLSRKKQIAPKITTIGL